MCGTGDPATIARSPTLTARAVCSAGVKFSASADPATRAAAAAISATAEEEIRAKKAAKKAAFDSEYDEGTIHTYYMHTKGVW